MKPTNRLRFVERESRVYNGEVFDQPFKVKILQQWWRTPVLERTIPEIIDGNAGEWRDVPIEVEE